MFDILISAFWSTAEQAVQLIVPVVAIILIFGMFNSVLFGSRRL